MPVSVTASCGDGSISRRRGFSRAALYAAIAIAYLAAFFLIGRNILDAPLSYDESGQIFISQGLNHWSHPYSQPLGLGHVIKNNSLYNLDPGGFSILLFFWEKVSHNLIWIRLLPFLFYIGAILLTCRLTYRLTSNKIASAMSGLLLFGFFHGSAAWEARGYSMEICGIIFGILMIYRLRDSLSWRNLMTTSLLLSFFITARYTMLAFGGIYSAYILWLIISSKESAGSKIAKTLSYSAPLLITVAYIFNFSFSVQNPGMNPEHYFDYLPFTFLFWVPMFYVLLMTAPLFLWRFQSTDTRFMVKFFYAISAIFCILGAFKILPWLQWFNKGIPFTWWLYETIFVCVIKWLGPTAKKISCCWILLGLWLAYTVVLHFALGCGSLSPAMHKAPWITDWEHELQRREIIDAPQVIVGINPSPAIRYYFEYGSLKEKATEMGYPSKFVLLGRGPHSHLYKMYNYVISDSVTFVDAPHGAALLGIDHGSSDPYIKTVDTDHWAITFKK